MLVVTLRRARTIADGLTSALAAHIGLYAQAAPAPEFDEVQARSVRAAAESMRKTVRVVPKTGPHKVPAGAERDPMFCGRVAHTGRHR